MFYVKYRYRWVTDKRKRALKLIDGPLQGWGQYRAYQTSKATPISVVSTSVSVIRPKV